MNWDETNRRLDDGIMVRVSDTPPMDGWVYVAISAPNGQLMYSGTMTLIQALIEIPFQLDRARAFQSAYQEVAP